MMELENLKENWQNASSQTPANNISKMIRLQSSTPIARLKKQFRKKMVVLPIVAFWLYYVLSRHHDVEHDILFWAYISFCAVVFMYAFNNYRKISRLGKMDHPVFAHLQQEIGDIEIGIHLHNRTTFIFLAGLMLLVELLMYTGLEPGLHKWQAVPILYRILIYAGFFVLKMIANKLIFKFRFKPHLDQLNNIIGQMK
jgi:hypothetical protein